MLSIDRPPRFRTGLIKRVNGVAGCTLLGDGSISLIVDVGELLEKRAYLSEGGRKNEWRSVGN